MPRWLRVFPVLLAIMALRCVRASDGDVLLPAELLDDHAVHVTVGFGTPREYVSARLDFTSAHIVVHPSLVAKSDTFDPGSRYDYVSVGDTLLFVPIVVASTERQVREMAATGARCLLGVGAGSHLWQRWRCAVFAASHVMLSRGACVYPPGASVFQCAPTTDASPLCLVDRVRVGIDGVAFAPMRVAVLGSSGARDYLPPVVYDHVRYTASAAQPAVCFDASASGGGQFCLDPHVYAPRSPRTLTFAPSASANTSTLSGNMLRGFQVHFDSEAQTLCTVRSRVRVHTPLLNEVLMGVWIGLAILWYTRDTQHVSILCVEYSNMGDARVIAVELLSASTVFVFCVHFYAKSAVWDMPLPGGTGVLSAYLLFTLALAVASMCDFVGGTLRAWKPCLVRPLLVEFQLLLALWIAQMDTLRGSWYTFTSLLFLAMFCFCWAQRLLLLWFVVTLDIETPGSTTKNGTRVLLGAMCVGMCAHIFVVLRYTLDPFFVSLGSANSACAGVLVVSILLLVVTLVARKTHDDLVRLGLCWAPPADNGTERRS